MRHPGASRFACSSTVQVNVLVFGQILDLLIEIVWLDADRALDALSADVVVTVAANVDDLHLVPVACRQTRREFFHLYPWHDAVFAIPMELRGAVDRICDQSSDDNDFHGTSRRVEPVQRGSQ